jgi:hypothetical protein
MTNSWKDKTFAQITSSISSNRDYTLNTTYTSKLLLKPLPLKIYRREIGISKTACNPRTSVRIDELNRAGGYIVYDTTIDGGMTDASANSIGIRHTLDIPISNSVYEKSGCATDEGGCFNIGSNALRRVRSAGMITKNKDIYYTSRTQYLVSRNKTFDQNQYNYLKSGSSTAEPGSSGALDNVYASQGISHCGADSYIPVYYKPNNSQFATQGAVSSSSLTTRLKYDTITTVGSSYRTPYGASMADALAYGVPTGGYTIKDKIGYPVKSTPVFNKYTGEMTKECI